jgi:hypothetical protein
VKPKTAPKRLPGAGKSGGDNTVKYALDRYESDLKTRGADVDNAKRARHHLSAKLAKKAVGALTTNDLREWRDELATKMTAASVNRTANAMRAALNLAADTDERISSRKAWEDGLKAITDAREARNVILPEQDVWSIIVGAYKDSEEFGEFVELAAVTGARPSQLARLQGEDIQGGPPNLKANKWQPRVMMPSSRRHDGAGHTVADIGNGLVLRSTCHCADCGFGAKMTLGSHQRTIGASLSTSCFRTGLRGKGKGGPPVHASFVSQQRFA